jgi:lysosomal alpha-mannosidase
LNETFGIPGPRVAWQLDPFGHSSFTPLLSAQFGYEFLVINRIPESDKVELRERSDMSFLWQNNALEEENGMLTYVLNDHYDTPPIIRRKDSVEYCWNGSDTEDNKIGNCTEKLVDLIFTWSAFYPEQENFMLLYGNDFEYDNLNYAQQDFENMEKLMEYAKENLDVEIRYSTPSEFLDSVLSE